MLQNLQHHDLSGPGAAGFAGRDQNILRDAAIFRHHKIDAVFFVQAADHAIVGAFQHLDDLGLGTAAPVHTALAHHHHIAMQHLVHFLLAEEHIRTAVFGNQETETIRVSLHLALDQIEFVHHADGALAVAHDLAVALHRAQAAQEQFLFIRFNLQHSQQFFIAYRRALFGQYLQDELDGWAASCS